VLRKASGKHVIVNGGISEGSHAEEVITSEAGDCVAIGRRLFAHPDWPHIIRSGETYPWLPFDRKYVIKPPYDYAHGYPLDQISVDWNPDVASRRKPGWMD
jgi:2,4-dienoyl-CoA reductase-like NADH-dependent reductase (Old Yellow Enzyme family)